MRYADGFNPVYTADGIVSYTGVTFSVPETRQFVLEAYYDDLVKEIDEVALTVKEPVPGEVLSAGDYPFGELKTTPSKDDNSPVCRDRNDPSCQPGQVKLTWLSGGAPDTGKIRYNTTYVVEATVEPIDGYVFKYPLASDEGTKALVNTQTADVFVPAGGPSALILHQFQTPKAQLLEVIQPADLYYPEGVLAETINAYLKHLPVSIRTEDEAVTETTANWNTVTQEMIPGAGKQFEVPCTVNLPDDIRNDEHPVDLKTKIVIHIIGDELMPPTADPDPGIYRSDLDVKLFTVHDDAEIQYYYFRADEEPADPEFVTFDEDNPIHLYRASHEIQRWTIRAKTVRGTKESQTAEFRYILMPAENEYVLIVQGGSAQSTYSSGSILYVPMNDIVTLQP